MAKNVGGTVAFFADDHKLLDAASAAYKAGYRKFDTISPFPIHGMDQAMGLKPSSLPWVTLFGGLAGLSAAVGMEGFVNSYDWPLVIGGKPFFGLPAFIPIMFELTVLIGGLSTVAALFAVCGLPKIDPPVIDLDLTSHKFALFVPDTESGYEATRVESFLQGIGGADIRRVEKY